MDDKYLSQFIIEAGKMTFTTPDGQQWRMRQPTPDEAADGDSAYRLAHQRILNDNRLKELAGSEEALQREAAIRATAAEAVYMLPLLLETKQEKEWVVAFDPFDQESLAEFEALNIKTIAEMTKIYWGPIQQAIYEAKKKSQSDLSIESPSVNH